MQHAPHILLLDGHAMAYRAFYAIRDLTTSAGLPVNAVYGFIRMRQQWAREWRPIHEIAVFDGGLSQERMELLPEYKAQREAMPEALDAQFPLIEEYLRLSGMPVVRLPGEEADDLLAVLVKQGKARGHSVLMATSDKDMFQLIDEQVGIILPNKSDERMGVAEVVAKTGVEPQRIAEWLALIGDASDNIPGVPGVGPKTAAKLLNMFGSIDALYNRMDEVPQEKTRLALIEHRDAVIRNLGMTRLKDDVKWPDMEAVWQAGAVDTAGLLAFYRRMEFKTFARELEAPDLFG